MAKHTKRNGRGYLPPTYRSYTFVSKDPAIDELRTVVQRHFKTNDVSGKNLRRITEEGGPSFAAMRGWFFGATRRPQNATLEAAGRALGYERVWRKRK